MDISILFRKRIQFSFHRYFLFCLPSEMSNLLSVTLDYLRFHFSCEAFSNYSCWLWSLTWNLLLPCCVCCFIHIICILTRQIQGSYFILLLYLFLISSFIQQNRHLNVMIEWFCNTVNTNTCMCFINEQISENIKAVLKYILEAPKPDLCSYNYFPSQSMMSMALLWLLENCLLLLCYLIELVREKRLDKNKLTLNSSLNLHLSNPSPVPQTSGSPRRVGSPET